MKEKPLDDAIRSGKFKKNFKSNISVKTTTQKDVLKICNWKYEEPYDFYNYPPYETLVEQGWGIADEATREKQFYSLYKNNELIGVFRFAEHQDYISLGLSLKPAYCGKGFGNYFMKIILSEFKMRFSDKRLILNVRAFNKRAIKLYMNNGFRLIDNPSDKNMLSMEYLPDSENRRGG